MSVSRLILALGVALAATPPAIAATAPTIWQGRSAGYTVSWTTENVTIRDAAGATVYAARTADETAYAKQEREQEAWNAEVMAGDDPDLETHRAYLRSLPKPYCGLDAQYAVLSVVGPLVSMRADRSEYCFPMAHPWGGASYAVVDARRPGKAVSLLDWFPDREVLQALLKDKLVGEALKGLDLHRTYPSAKALVAAIAPWSGACDYGFDKELLSHFAFHHLEGDRVAVRLGLSHGCEAARGNLTQIGILLRIPPALRQALKDADARRAGYLMKAEPAVSHGRRTHFRLGGAV